VKILVLLVGGLYAWAFAGQYVKAHFVDPGPAMPNPLQELHELHDLERQEMGDYLLWTERRIPESQLRDIEVEVRRRREDLRTYLR